VSVYSAVDAIVPQISQGETKPWLAREADLFDNYHRVARESTYLLRSIDSAPLKAGAYLGIDPASTSKWRNLFGGEGWVLFGIRASDTSGGPAISDHSFGYNVHSGLTSSLRAARESPDPSSSYVPLEEPITARDITGYVDNVPEDYPHGTAPDLYLDVTIPAGRHILTIPIASTKKSM